MSETNPRVVGCSVKGPKHKRREQPCEDATDSIELGDDRFVIAVADGLGSAKYAEKGSQLATEEATEFFKSQLESNENIFEDSYEDVIYNGFETIRGKLSNKAEDLETDVSNLGTTLLIIIGDSTHLVGGVVGDGGIVYQEENDEEDYHQLVTKESEYLDMENTTATYPLHHPEWKKSYRHEHVENYSSAAVFTDGFDELVYEEDLSPDSEFFGAIFELVRDQPDVESAKELMKEIFDDSPYVKFSDDKTISVVTTNVETE